MFCLPCITCVFLVNNPPLGLSFQNRLNHLLLKSPESHCPGLKQLWKRRRRNFEERERVLLAEQRECEERLRRESSLAREDELVRQMSMLHKLQETQNRFLGELLCHMPALAPTHYYVPPRYTRFNIPSTSEETENSTFTPLSSSLFLQLD